MENRDDATQSDEDNRKNMKTKAQQYDKNFLWPQQVNKLHNLLC